MGNQYEIVTDVSKNGLISQKFLQNKTNELSRWVCDIRERSIIEVLISLGWIPPNDIIDLANKK